MGPDTLIQEAGFSYRTSTRLHFYMCYRRGGIRMQRGSFVSVTLRDVSKMSEPELYSAKGIGEVSMAEIKKTLASVGLTLAGLRHDRPITSGIRTDLFMLTT